MMKAVFCTAYGPPEVLKIDLMEKPFPKEKEVLIRIHATTVTAADYRIRSFTVPPSFWLPARLMLGLKKPKNAVLGMELSGTVEATGKDVKSFKRGDKVFAATLQTFGGYAEFKCLDEDGPISKMPVNTTFEEAAAIPIGARTAYHYIKTLGNVKQGEKVLIYGASGSVGTYAIQLAKYFGAEVTGVCSTKNIELVKSLGANQVISYETEDFTQQFDRYNIIFVTIDKCPFIVCKKALKKNGSYFNIGRPLPSLHMLWTSITSSKKIIVGKNSPETAEALITLKSIIEEGKLKPVIDRSYTLDEIVEAHRYVDQGHKKGNVVININNETQD